MKLLDWTACVFFLFLNCAIAAWSAARGDFHGAGFAGFVALCYAFLVAVAYAEDDDL